MELIVAMVVSALVTHAFEQSHRRSAAAWQEARRRAEQRGAERQQAWQQRRQRWSDRFDTARQHGPTHPLWWAYASGWAASAVVLAGVAGAKGLGAGAVAGARGGYRVGRDAADRGWGYRQTWQQWRETVRQRRSQAGEAGPGTCEACGTQVAVEDLVLVPELGRVCRDCVPVRPRSSDGRGAQTRDNAETTEACRSCGVYVTAAVLDAHGQCPDCLVTRGTGGSTSGRDEATGDTTGGDRAARGRIVVEAQRLDEHENTESTSDGGTTAMGELMPSSGDATQSVGTGEGYTDTVSTLATLEQQLTAAYNTVQTLGETLNAHEVDNDTISQVSELMDLLETAAPLAQQTHQHVTGRHEPLANAVAEAGGSSNVASRSWYDDF